MEIRRDNLGFILLDDKGISLERYPDALGTFTFTLNGTKYYFKRSKNVNQIYNELIGYEIAKDFGIPAVEYDLASCEGFIGNISADYMKDGYVVLEELLKSFYKCDENRCNYNDVAEMFFALYYEASNNLIDDLLRLLMFDITIGNSDRHDRNILIDQNNLRLAPISDNEMLLSPNALNGSYFSFSIDRDKDKTIKKFISYLTPGQLATFKEKLSLISNEHLLIIFARIEHKIGAKMVPEIKQEILSKYSAYLKYLNKLINKDKGFRLLFKKNE